MLFSQIGAPIPVEKKAASDITQEDIDKLHEKFINEMIRLFNRTKESNGFPNSELKVL